MNTSQLSATVQANKGPLLAAAAAGVAGLALLRKKKAPAADPTADTGYSAGSQTAGMSGAYDSTASDLYGAVGPQLESLAGQITNLQNSLNTPPVKVPAPPALGQPKIPAGTNPKSVITPTPWIPPARSVPVPVKKPAAAANFGGPQFVTVKPGDTLSGIAAPYAAQITPATVGQLNGIRNLNLIRPGQRLRMY